MGAACRSRRSGVPAIGSQAVHAHGGHENVRDCHTPIFLLVVFEDRDDRARECQARRVQRVDELWLPSAFRTVPNVCTTCLKIRERAGTGDFKPRAHPRGPHLEIKGLGRRETQIARGERHHPVRQAEALEHGRRVPQDRLQFRRRVGGAAEPHQLDLVELVHALDSAGVLSVRPCFSPKTRRVRHVPNRQIRLGQNLVAVKVGDRDLCRGNQIEIVLYAVHLALLVGQLARAQAACRIDQRRRPRFTVSVLAGVEVHHEVDQGPDEPRARAGVHRKPAAADLGPAMEIHQAEGFHEIPVWCGFEVQRRRLTPGAHHRVGRLIAGRNVVELEIGNPEDRIPEVVLDVPQFGFERLDVPAHVLEPGE
jgi:hypothetical protein